MPTSNCFVIVFDLAFVKEELKAEFVEKETGYLSLIDLLEKENKEVRRV
jgi:hypothetical protein